jgi:hypothetical protein
MSFLQLPPVLVNGTNGSVGDGNVCRSSSALNGVSFMFVEIGEKRSKSYTDKSKSASLKKSSSLLELELKKFDAAVEKFDAAVDIALAV